MQVKNIQGVKGMMNKIELDYAAMGVLLNFAV
jgi:hypothetical protein